jgi:hypothetical protein
MQPFWKDIGEAPAMIPESAMVYCRLGVAWLPSDEVTK